MLLVATEQPSLHFFCFFFCFFCLLSKLKFLCGSVLQGMYLHSCKAVMASSCPLCQWSIWVGHAGTWGEAVEVSGRGFLPLKETHIPPPSLFLQCLQFSKGCKAWSCPVTVNVRWQSYKLYSENCGRGKMESQHLWRDHWATSILNWLLQADFFL